MIQEYAIRWAEALESGKYEQGYGCLKQINTCGFSYCCLGVACEIFKEEAGLAEINLCFVDKENIEDVSSGHLTQKLAEFLNIQSKDKSSPSVDDIHFVEMNDIKRMSFKEIAQVIRENWEKI